MCKNLFPFIFLAGFTMALAVDLCPNGGMIVGEGIGKSKAAADRAADVAISQNIVSGISANSFDALSQKMEDGVPIDYNSYLETTKGHSELLNKERVKQLKPHYEKNGEFISERYICHSDAAKPYLDKMRHLTDSLKFFTQRINKETCHNMLDVYKQIRIWEGVAENLGQADKVLKNEYGGFYDKMKRECVQMGSGMFFDEGGSNANPITTAIIKTFKQKVDLSDGTCTNGIKTAIESDDEPLCSEGMVGIACKANVQLIITQCKDGKKTVLKGAIVGMDKYSEGTANKQMMRNIEKADFWKEWVRELEKRSK